jgi:hypothetical protein
MADLRVEGPGAWRARAPYYAAAVALTALALVAGALITPAAGSVMFAPLVGAVALSGWLGGLGPALLSIALGGASIVRPRPHLGFALHSHGAGPLAAFIVVGLIVSGLAAALRATRERAQRAERRTALLIAAGPGARGRRRGRGAPPPPGRAGGSRARGLVPHRSA